MKKYSYVSSNFIDLWQDGRHYRIKKTHQGLSQSEDSEAGDLQSPLPGKISKINVQVSQKVIQGELLLSLEAMKMEYKILAPFDGTVTALPFSEGDQVEMGVLLVEIEEDEK